MPKCLELPDWLRSPSEHKVPGFAPKRQPRLVHRLIRLEHAGLTRPVLNLKRESVFRETGLYSDAYR